MAMRSPAVGAWAARARAPRAAPTRARGPRPARVPPATRCAPRRAATGPATPEWQPHRLRQRAAWQKRYAESEGAAATLSVHHLRHPDQAALHARGPGRHGPAARPRRSRASIPYTRGVHTTMYRGRMFTMRQFSGFAHAARVEPALPLACSRRADRALDRLRQPDHHGLRLRPPEGARRGRQVRRGGRSACATWRSCSTASIRA